MVNTDVSSPRDEQSIAPVSDRAGGTHDTHGEVGDGAPTTRTVTVSATTVIDKVAAEVWHVIGDYRNDPAWRGGVGAMDLLDPAPVTVGDRTREVIRVTGRTYTTVAEITAMIPGRRLDFASVEAAVPVHGHREVRPLGSDSCEVVYELSFRLDGYMAAIAPLFAATYRRRIRRDLARLRDLVSGSRLVTAASGHAAR